MAQWYEALFDNFASNYDKEIFTQGTLQEAAFIHTELNHNADQRILDIGCGTGRHAIELARKGYRVTGIDLSASQLKRAREKAIDANVSIEWFIQDARTFRFEHRFDAAIMICEGAFSLMETDEMNFQILKNAFESIHAGGKFIFTTLNALFPLYHNVKEFLEKESYNEEIGELTFDLMTFREHSTLKMQDDDGVEKVLTCNERYYTPSEITWLLKSIGFQHIEIFGCDTGHFSRETALTPDHFEMLVIAEKP